MKTRRLHLAAALAFVITPSLIGCGQDLSTNPAADLNASSEMSSAITAASGKALFESVQKSAIGSLSLSDLVLLTPYLSGERTIENSSLSQLVTIPPA